MLRQGELWTADAAGIVRRLDSRNFDVKAERALPHPASGLWTDGERCWVQLTDGRLASLRDSSGLPDEWVTELGPVRLLGPPVSVGGSLHWVSREGLHVQLDAQNGQEQKRDQLPQNLAHGLLSLGQALWTSAEDGTVYRISPSEGQAQ